MREFKFRAWDKEKAAWVSVGFSIIGEVTVFDMLKGYSIENFKNIEIMAFTGLKDVKGRDVYEGDIVSRPYHDDKDDETIRALVKWNSTFCGFEPFFDQGPELYNNWALMDFEVIGNIYQTPELWANNL